MPNHLHLVVSAFDHFNHDVLRRASSPYRLTRMLESLKWYSARECNKLVGRQGPFWRHESYDHAVRDDAELERVIWYVLRNPVKARLCRRWQDWKWTYAKEEFLRVWQDASDATK